MPASMWLDRAAIFAVPAAAGLAVAVTIVGAGRERPALGARVHGLPVAGSAHWALRIETLRAERGRVRPAPDEPLRVELACRGSRAAQWSGRSDHNGIAEASLALEQPARGCADASGFRVEIHGTGALLAAATITPQAPLPVELIEPLYGTRQGPVRLAVSLPRGQAVASLPERVEIAALLPAAIDGVALSCASTGSPMPPADGPPQVALEVAMQGGTVAPETTAPQRRCEAGVVELRWSRTIVAEAPPVEIEVTARVVGLEPSTWRGELPVVLGWSWADERAVGQGRLRVRSVSAQPEVYASLVSPAGRLWGLPLGLASDGRGFTELEQPLPPLPDGPVELRLSSDPSEPPDSTARWPLRPQLGSLPTARLVLLADAMAAAQRAEQRRQGRARLPALVVVAVAGLFELSFLLRRYALGRKRAELAVAAAYPPTADRRPMVAKFGLLWLGVLGAGVAVAFVALAALALWG